MLVLALLALTIVHIAWRALPGRRAALTVAEFQIGTPVPPFSSELLGVGPRTPRTIPTAGCRIIVAFSSTCPHCKAAFSRAVDAVASTDLPVIWLADGRDRGAPAVRGDLRVGDYLTRSSDGWKKLEVRAVPAAFLVGADDIVKSIWVYQGDENADSVRRSCGAR